MSIKVDLIDVMGDDITVCNAARVSFNKFTCYDLDDKLKDSDVRLIKYLATHEHWSPFAHPQVSFRVSAPVFVARQLQKHTVGLAWNEISRRYVDTEPSFFTPEVWRKRAENVKQGSSNEVVTLFGGDDIYTRAVQEAFYTYRNLLEQGVCPEQARMVLPQSMMTEWIWTGSLYAFARVCKLRLDDHTQYETRLVAQQISEHMQKLFPVSWEALVGTER